MFVWPGRTHLPFWKLYALVMSVLCPKPLLAQSCLQCVRQHMMIKLEA